MQSGRSSLTIAQRVIAVAVLFAVTGLIVLSSLLYGKAIDPTLDGTRLLLLVGITVFIFSAGTMAVIMVISRRRTTELPEHPIAKVDLPFFQVLRTILCWIFALECLELVLSFAILYLINPFHRNLALPQDASGTAKIVVFLGIYFVAAVTYGKAWWTVWKRKTSSKAWAIAASFLNLIQWIPFVNFSSRWYCTHWRFIGLHCTIGIVGLAAFLAASQEPVSAAGCPTLDPPLS
jgi:uncharacterized membrane protein YbhN (UPF0104 family)